MDRGRGRTQPHGRGDIRGYEGRGRQASSSAFSGSESGSSFMETTGRAVQFGKRSSEGKGNFEFSWIRNLNN